MEQAEKVLEEAFMILGLIEGTLEVDNEVLNSAKACKWVFGQKQHLHPPATTLEGKYTDALLVKKYNTYLKQRAEFEEKMRIKCEEEEQRRQAEEAAANEWASNRFPGEKPITNLIADYREHLQREYKITNILNKYSTFNHQECEAILSHLTSLFSKDNNIYEKNTLLAMKALNRFAREQEIDVNSAIIVMNEFL